ncbi:hypothetical protein [Agaricicola taiwanensis]|nr:hypothetical protein [Agaricicola taiwanensis]
MTNDNDGLSKLDDADPKTDSLEARETARYVAAMATSLSDMARRDGLDLVAYFLEMARVEALQVERNGP